VVGSAARLGAASLAGAAVVGVVASTAPAAGAASGFFSWTGISGQQLIFFPDDDKCYPTPGGSLALNYTAADALLFSDGYCTSGQDAGDVPPFAHNSARFNSMKLRITGRSSTSN